MSTYQEINRSIRNR